MKCRDCLVWQRRVESLKERITEFVPGYARLLNDDEVAQFLPLIGEEAERLDKLFRWYISLMDEKCTAGRCKLF